MRGGQRYPVKQIISMATSEPKTSFSGGYEANSYGSKRGFSVVALENKVDYLSIYDGLEEILAYYVSARDNEPFKGHALRLTFNGVSHAIAATNTVSKRPTVTAKASIGQGNWATIPWISLLDTRETNTTQRGVYCVYLFREDMSGVYLALAQGVTEPKEQYGNVVQAREQLRTRAEYIRQYCEGLPQYGFALDDNIDLHTDSGLGGSAPVLERWLEKQSLPQEDKELILRLFVNLNRRIQLHLGEHFQVGHSYFMVADIASQAGRQRVWSRAVMPLLEEYFYNWRDRNQVLSEFQVAQLLSDQQQP